jgi:hypothetical protein
LRSRFLLTVARVGAPDLVKAASGLLATRHFLF